MLSIVIPFYNETKRLESGGNLISGINFIQKQYKGPLELVLVDDGSSDNTVEILNKVKSAFEHILVEVIRYEQNQGKGYAVKQGVLACTGAKVIVMDADFSIDLNEIPKFVEALDEHDVVIGSKKHFLTQTRVSQKMPRRILGKGYTWLTNVMLGLKFTDVTCGFKGFKTHVGKDLFSRQRINRFAYDSETLFLGKKLGYTTKELPVNWYHVESSKVNPLIDTGRSFRDLLIILFNYYNGKYK